MSADKKQRKNSKDRFLLMNRCLQICALNFALILISFSNLLAQCDNQIYQSCIDPPLMCDLIELDAYQVCLPDSDGTSTIGFCNFEDGMNNPIYFSFVAGVSFASIRIELLNCDTIENNIGLQANVIEPCAPNICFGNSGQECFTSDFSFEVSNLEIAKVYQLVIDGCGGSKCEFVIHIEESTALPIEYPEKILIGLEQDENCDALIEVNLTSGFFDLCQRETYTFKVDNLIEDHTYCWSIEGPDQVNLIGSSVCTGPLFDLGGVGTSCNDDFMSTCDQLDLEFNTAGSYTLCLENMSYGCTIINQEDFGELCIGINVVEMDTLDWGILEICEEDIDHIIVPAHPITGQQWNGSVLNSAGEHLNGGLENCVCTDYQKITIDEIPILILDSVFYTICINDIYGWVDSIYGIGFWRIHYGTGDSIVNQLVELYGEEGYLNWEGEDCGVSAPFSIKMYSVPGKINKIINDSCSLMLSFEIDDSVFPSYINRDSINFEWFSHGEFLSTEQQIIVENPAYYDVNIYFQIEDGSSCVHPYSLKVEEEDFVLTNFHIPEIICSNELPTVEYTLESKIPNAMIFWEVENANIISGQASDSILVEIIDYHLPVEINVNIGSEQCGFFQNSFESNILFAPEVDTVELQYNCTNVPVFFTATHIEEVKTYHWSFDDSQIQTSVNPFTANLMVIFTNPGLKEYTLVTEDFFGCFSEPFMGSIEVLDCNISSTTKNSTDNELTVFPNPASELLVVDDNEIDELVLINANGKLFHSNKVSDNSFDISQLPSGIYFVKLIRDNKSSIIKKIIKL